MNQYGDLYDQECLVKGGEGRDADEVLTHANELMALLILAALLICMATVVMFFGKW